jgi:hypothetical protein
VLASPTSMYPHLRAAMDASRVLRHPVSSSSLSLSSLSLGVRVVSLVVSGSQCIDAFGDSFAGFLIFAIITIVVTKHRRPKFSDAANRRRELERQRQLDSSMALMGYTGYDQVDMRDVDAKALPPTPPSNSSPIPIIKVYPASERSLRRASVSTLGSPRDSHDSHDSEAYPRESYDDTSGEDQEPILSRTAPPGESINEEHDSPPPVSAFSVTGLS